jgi:hypothetical protein
VDEFLVPSSRVVEVDSGYIQEILERHQSQRSMSELEIELLGFM